MYRLLTLLLLINTANLSFSQELNCEVQVLTQQIQGTDKRIFESLKTNIIEFMNNRKWTDDIIKNNERIDCSILINITKRITADEFQATIQVQSRRPVFNTSYNSLLFNFNDKDFHFNYVVGQPLVYVENVYSTNLSSVLSFYAYLIIGMDYDSFALNGGDPYLQEALSIVNNAQSSSESGWKAFDGSQNRYWIINNMLDASFIPLRTAMYKYHRLGMDIMATDKEKARIAITESIVGLKQIHAIKPLSFSLQVFFNAKSDEIIDIYKKASPAEKSVLVKLLKKIDPTNSNDYTKILANK